MGEHGTERSVAGRSPDRQREGRWRAGGQTAGSAPADAADQLSINCEIFGKQRRQRRFTAFQCRGESPLGTFSPILEFFLPRRSHARGGGPRLVVFPRVLLLAEAHSLCPRASPTHSDRGQTTETPMCLGLSPATTKVSASVDTVGARAAPAERRGSRSQSDVGGRRTDRRTEAPRSAFRRTNWGPSTDRRERAVARALDRRVAGDDRRERGEKARPKNATCSLPTAAIHCYCVQFMKYVCIFWDLPHEKMKMGNSSATNESLCGFHLGTIIDVR